MERTRVALVITELAVGGAERCLTNLALGLDRARFDVAVYSLGPRPAPPRQTLVEALEDAAIPVRFLGVTAYRQSLGAIRRLRALLREQRPHVVQTFLFHANVSGALAVRPFRNMRLVAGIRVADPSRWRRWLERRVCGRADRVVCVSRSVAEYYRTQIGWPKEKLIVIPNGIEVSRYAAVSPADLSQFGIAPGRRAIVYVGRLDRQKGLDVLLSIAPSLLAQLPNCDLLLVGDGPEGASLRAQAKTLQQLDRLHFAGWRPDVPGILAASSLAVLPSRWEGMPNAVLEAMAAGIPIVSTRVEGVEELLGPHAQEQTVPVGDGPCLLSQIVTIARDPAAAAELGRANRQRAEACFSVATMVQAYERTYAALRTPTDEAVAM